MLILKGGAVVTMDDAIGTLATGDVLIDGDRIAAVAPHLEAPPSAEVVDARGAIVMPGFVNAHIHTWQTGLRGVAADWTINEYLRAMHAGLATRFRAEDIYIANLAGALNQIDCGTTTLVDWCHNNPEPAYTDAAIRGLDEAGIRALFLHGSPKPDPKEGQKHYSEVPHPRAEVERLLKGRFASDEGLLTFGLAILGPGMSTYEVTLADLKLARELGLMASMHVTGRQLVPDGFRRLCLETDLIGPWANLVHANNLSDEYLALLVERGAGFTVTAEVEMQMGYGRPLTTRLRALGQAFSIGSDIESGMSADMFAVTRTTLQNARFVDGLDAIAATGIGPQAITITCAEALRWATMDGARMARLDHKVGSLTPGKQADVVVLRFPPPVSGPIHDPVAWIVLQGGRHAVDAVLIAGRFVKRDGRLLAADTEGIAARLARSGARIVGELRAAAPAH